MNPRSLILGSLVVAPAFALLAQAFSKQPPREIYAEEFSPVFASFTDSFFSYRTDVFAPQPDDALRLPSVRIDSGPLFDTDLSAHEHPVGIEDADSEFLSPLERWTVLELITATTPDLAPDDEPPSVVFFVPAHIPPPSPPVILRSGEKVPMYDAWVKTLRNQPPPKRAQQYLPELKRIFAEEGVPEEFAWLPEVESTFNPRAVSRRGARGLFQFMPLTAREQGLSLRPHDERIHPLKSARAAAVLLRQLHDEFESWPLALAAYNAGGGRVRRTLQARDATTFAEIADRLPLETRLYVPKVLATLSVREGVTPSTLSAPRYATTEREL